MISEAAVHCSFCCCRTGDQPAFFDEISYDPPRLRRPLHASAGGGRAQQARRGRSLISEAAVHCSFCCCRTGINLRLSDEIYYDPSTAAPTPPAIAGGEASVASQEGGGLLISERPFTVHSVAAEQGSTSVCLMNFLMTLHPAAPTPPASAGGEASAASQGGGRSFDQRSGRSLFILLLQNRGSTCVCLMSFL